MTLAFPSSILSAIAIAREARIALKNCCLAAFRYGHIALFSPPSVLWEVAVAPGGGGSLEEDAALDSPDAFST